jgi:hypothetical protein
MGGSLKGYAGRIIGTGVGAGTAMLSRESNSTVVGVGAARTVVGGATGTEGMGAIGTMGRAEAGTGTAKGNCQKDMVKSEAEEPERSSCGKGRSNRATKGSVNATDAAAGDDPP